MTADQIMALRGALNQTTGTAGWPYVEKFAETIVRELEAASVAEDDDIKANGLRRDARGARKFKDKLFERINWAKNQEPEQFNEVATD